MSDDSELSASAIVARYLLQKSREFRQLSDIRQKGWQSTTGDEFFQKQRHHADHCNRATAQFFYKMMQRIGRELEDSTGCFTIKNCQNQYHKILDLCSAPGGFLKVALESNPDALATGFSLPITSGGHNLFLPPSPSVEIRWADITMFAADMGVQEIPEAHPDRDEFLPRQLAEDIVFDLVLCDGQVLRTHKRAAYRERLEGARLGAAQLVLGFQHIRAGGTMVILLHKIEAWPNVFLIYILSRFSTIKLFKSAKSHAKRSSFYLIATNISKKDPEFGLAIEHYKTMWQVATFCQDSEYDAFATENETMVHEVLQQFGSTLTELGTCIWRTQKDALERASFNQNA